MQVVHGSDEFDAGDARQVLTIGNFDGLHRGHQSIMETVLERTKHHGARSAVLTFAPHPRVVLGKDNPPKMLTTLEQKLELFEAAGIDVVIVEPFTKKYASMPPEKFVREIVWKRICPVEVYVGYDFHFGRDRAGSMRTLTELGPMLGFAVTIIPEVQFEEQDVSSTRIRELLSHGDVGAAAVLLGRPYGVRGCVVQGDQRGRTLGFPTLNLEPENEVLPAEGVYAGRVRFLDAGEPVAGAEFDSVINVGRRPTLKTDADCLAEAHLIDFDSDAYGRQIEVCFLEGLREERRFSGPEELSDQIRLDVEEAKKLLAASRVQPGRVDSSCD